MRVLAKPQKIRKFAARKSLADYEIAEGIGVTKQAFGNVMRGISCLRPAARRRLLHLLDAQFDDLFEIADDGAA